MNIRVRRLTAVVGAVAAALIVIVLLRHLITGSAGDTSLPPAVVTPSPGARPSPAVTPQPSGPPSPGSQPGQPLPPVSVEGSRITGSDPAGRVEWELRAVSVEVDNARQQIRLEGVEGTFFEKEKATIIFSAPRGIFDIAQRDVVLSGRVRARTPSGARMEADVMHWIAGRRLLVATGNILLAQQKLTVRADRMETDVGLRKTRVSGNVKLTVTE